MRGYQRKLEYNRQRYWQNPEQVIARNREYAQKRRKTNPEIYRNNALKRRYGITLEQFNAIIEAFETRINRSIKWKPQ